jgi:hypothetical protein
MFILDTIYEGPILQKRRSIVSDTCLIPILPDTRIREYQTIKIIFLKNNYRYVSDTSPIHVSEMYRENNDFL